MIQINVYCSSWFTNSSLNESKLEFHLANLLRNSGRLTFTTSVVFHIFPATSGISDFWLWSLRPCSCCSLASWWRVSWTREKMLKCSTWKSSAAQRRSNMLKFTSRIRVQRNNGVHSMELLLISVMQHQKKQRQKKENISLECRKEWKGVKNLEQIRKLLPYESVVIPQNSGCRTNLLRWWWWKQNKQELISQCSLDIFLERKRIKISPPSTVVHIKATIETFPSSTEAIAAHEHLWNLMWFWFVTFASPSR